MSAKDTIAAYEALIGRAEACARIELDGDDRVRARLTIEGDEAVLSWPRLEGAYHPYLTTEDKRFPARLLDAPVEMVIAWHKAMDSAQRKREALWKAKNVERQEQRERHLLTELLQKYGRPDE